MKTNKSTIYPVRNATYNQRGQLTTLDQGSFTLGGDRLLTSFSYDDSTKRRGWLTGTTVSRGVNSPPAAADVLLNLKMDYFDNGNVKSVQQTAGGTSDNPTFTNNYDYDGQERLRYAESKGADGTVATGIFPWEAYSFDSLNRMTARRIGGATYPYAYEAPNTSPKHVDAPTGYMGYHYDYDANGSQIK